MNFDLYQEEAKKTAVYPSEKGIEYCCLGLASEAGEVCQIVKKELRQGRDVGTRVQLNLLATSSDFAKKMSDELGDVLWYISSLATELGLDLYTIAEGNIAKLQLRQETGTLKTR